MIDWVHKMAIKTVLLGLGSNVCQDKLNQGILLLSSLGSCVVSDVISGQDYTACSRRTYDNACLLLSLTHENELVDLLDIFKKIEIQCGRDSRKKTAQYDYEVAMDIDVLAWQIGDDWHADGRRLPLKPHEKIAAKQVAKQLFDWSVIY